MSSSGLRFRHVHLDFHTHAMVENVGGDFDARDFQQALRAGCVDSINVFSKCHHGWTYHPTDVGWSHPNLQRDLLGEQIAAAHEIGVRAPVYISAGYDEAYLDHHPGDALVSPIPPKHPPTEAGYRAICFRSAYVEHLFRQTEEVAQRYDVDGWWMDIVLVRDCVCRRCMAELVRRGQDPENPAHVRALAVESRNAYVQGFAELATRLTPDAHIVQNGGHVRRGDRTFITHQTHIEMESLPTAHWGYDHFPVSARYAATLGKDYLGMTGRFHTVWGEFGGYKHDNALRYECAAMIAQGARCSIGDQLDPAGRMDEETYRKIGLAYAEVQAKEPWCRGAQHVADIAILSVESLAAQVSEMAAHIADRNPPADTGAARMLLERQVGFDVIDPDTDLERYRLLVLPDTARLGTELATRLRTYVEAGGKVLLTGLSGMAVDRDAFVLPVGTFHVRTGTDMDFFKATEPLLKRDHDRRLVRSPFVLEGNSFQVTPPEGATVLAELWHSQFNRSIVHFCGHQHAPASRQSAYPAAFVTGNIGYVASEIFTQYLHRGQMLYRDMVWLMLDHLLGGQWLFQAGLPSMGRATLMRQEAQDRHVLHLLYASPIQRPQHAFPRWNLHKTEVIEDIVPLHDVPCAVRLDRPVKQVRLVPEGREIPFGMRDGAAQFVVPRVECHQMVEIA